MAIDHQRTGGILTPFLSSCSWDFSAHDLGALLLGLSIIGVTCIQEPLLCGA